MAGTAASMRAAAATIRTIRAATRLSSSVFTRSSPLVCGGARCAPVSRQGSIIRAAGASYRGWLPRPRGDRPGTQGAILRGGAEGGCGTPALAGLCVASGAVEWQPEGQGRAE